MGNGPNIDIVPMLRLSLLLLFLCIASGQRRTGEWRQLDTNDQDVISAAEAAIDLVNEQSNSLYAIQAVRVVSAKRQVVAGIKYELVIDAGLSSCLKSAPSHTLAACPLTASAQRYTITLVDQAWQGMARYILVSHTIAEVPEENQGGTPPSTPCVGCPTKQTSITPEAEKAAQAGIAAYNAATLKSGGTSSPFMLTQVKSVTTQVVAGTLYKLTVLAAPSVCLDGTPAADEAETKKRIANWLSAKLALGEINQYGDSPGSMYTGGSPLFDESTGKTSDLDSYVKAQHPDAPWNSLCTVRKGAEAKEFSMTVWDQPWRTPRYVLQAHSLPTSTQHTASMLGASEGKHHKEGDGHAQGKRMRRLGAALGGVACFAILIAVAAYGFRAMRARAEDEAGSVVAETTDEPGFAPLSEEEEAGLVHGDTAKASV